MTQAPLEPTILLRRSLASGRIHSGYLLSGDADAARAAALEFARALVCSADEVARRPCGECRDCARSSGSAAGEEPIEIDGTGKRGPLFRHIGDHPDLFWVDRGNDATRVRIGQVRALRGALRLGSHEGGRRVVVIADAEWLNVEAQNALLRLLEEPPRATTLVLATASAAGLLATIRSRCQRVRFPILPAPPLRSDEAPEAVRAIALRLDRASQAPLPEILDWAEEYRGERARAAAGVQELLATGAEWLRERATAAARAGQRDLQSELDAFGTLQRCRKDLAQRNANPQMVAERALFALRTAAGIAR
jgi:DNA polymerase III delta prime subunit